MIIKIIMFFFKYPWKTFKEPAENHCLVGFFLSIEFLGV